MRMIIALAPFVLLPALASLQPACAPPEDDGGGEGEGEGEEDELARCRDACLLDEDCDRAGEACDEDAGVCGVPDCESDVECIVRDSGWLITPCDADTPCDAGVCIDLDGDDPGVAGGCGIRVTDAGGTCPFGAPLDVFDIDGNGVSVCAAERTCNDASGACEAPPPPAQCEDDAACADRGVGFTRCVDGRCGCAGDDDCVGSFGGSACIADGAFCGCAEDSECTDPRADICVIGSGLCECSTDEICNEDQRCAIPPPAADID